MKASDKEAHERYSDDGRYSDGNKSLADSIDDEKSEMSEYTVDVVETELEAKSRRLTSIPLEMGVETSFVRRGLSRFHNAGDDPSIQSNIEMIANSQCDDISQGGVADVDLDKPFDVDIPQDTTKITDEDEESFRLREHDQVNTPLPFYKVHQSSPSRCSIACKFFLVALLTGGVLVGSFFASRAIITRINQKSSNQQSSAASNNSISVPNGSSSTTSVPNDSNSTSQTAETSNAQSTRADEISQFVQSISDKASLEDSYSPQSQAFKWVTYTDTQQLSLTGTNNVSNARLGQRYVMSVLFYSLNGNEWQDITNWLSEKRECTWDQVECSSNNRITKIDLTSSGVSGSIPKEIAYLTNLEELVLSKNKIQKSIPSTIGKLKNLNVLDLRQNKMTGTLPESFYNLAALRFAYLSENQFKGSISSSIGDLTKLEWLVLSENRFHEEVPQEVVSLASLEIIDFRKNFFAGKFPFKYMSNLTVLSFLDLSENYFSGSLTNALSKLTDLSYLALNDNTFTGTIPPIIGDLLRLRSLQLSNNMFTGNIPNTLGRLQSLETLALDGNNLQGNMPNSVCLLRSDKLAEITSDCKQELECMCCTTCS